MFEKLEIQKKEDVVIVHVKLKKKINKKTHIISFSWKEAQAKIREKHPEIKIGNPLDYKTVLTNNKGENLEESWIFPIIMEQKKAQEKALESPKEVPELPKEALESPKEVSELQKKSPERSPQRISLSSKKNKNKNRLTTQENPATVEKTEQSLSDQPVIVQEPTE